MRRALLIAVLAASLQAGCATAAVHNVSACKGSDLHGTFKAVPGSQGAGNIVYALRLRNVSAGSCTVKGIPHVQLLSANGNKLPTNAVAAHPGVPGVLVTLAPNKTAVSDARFSPDVPGKGEPQLGHCEAKSYKLRVMPSGGGALIAPITPPTPVCEHGGMALSALQ
jgi:Protein of unknown function (DUF4232)